MGSRSTSDQIDFEPLSGFSQRAHFKACKRVLDAVSLMLNVAQWSSGYLTRDKQPL